jgi:hypothetical protein
LFDNVIFTIVRDIVNTLQMSLWIPLFGKPLVTFVTQLLFHNIII